MGQSTLLKPAWALTGSTRRRRHHPRQPSQPLNYVALLRSGQTLDWDLTRQRSAPVGRAGQSEAVALRLNERANMESQCV
jgi:hypothetical protein